MSIRSAQKHKVAPPSATATNSPIMLASRVGTNYAIELAVFNKFGGLLTKKIELIADKVVSDGSACTMARGRAMRVTLGHVGELVALIESLNSNQAIALGSPRDDLPDEVNILTKRELAKGPVKGTVARTAENFRYRPGHAALVLFDFDMKGMPPSVAFQLKVRGGFWAAMVAVAPALATAGYLKRLSTSAGLSRVDTGEEFGGSGGLHIYITIRDGTDAVRFLTTLHARCWLAGFGWMVVGRAGQLLERRDHRPHGRRGRAAGVRRSAGGVAAVATGCSGAEACGCCRRRGQFADGVSAAEHHRAAAFRSTEGAGAAGAGSGMRGKAGRMDRQPGGGDGGAHRHDRGGGHRGAGEAGRRIVAVECRARIRRS